MNIVEMKMMDEYYANNRSILEDLNIPERKNKPSFDEKKEFLKDEVGYQQLTEYAFDNPQIIDILYEHFYGQCNY